MRILPDGFYSLRKSPMDSLSDLCVVVPTIRPDSMRDFIERWGVDGLHSMNLIIVHDGEGKIGLDSESENIHEVCWGTIHEMLGDSEWIIPRKTDCVRSFGFLIAAKMGAKYILSMDDDCFPADGRTEDFFMSHLEILSCGLEPSFSTTGRRDSLMRPRGILRRDGESLPSRRVLINHGLWDGNLDMAGDDSIATMEFLGRKDVPMRWLEPRFDVIPNGFSYPMCGMNVSFSTDILPAMFFTLQGTIMVEGIGTRLDYDRWGDIWCGLLSKKVVDGMGGYVTSGVPRVFHSRASSAIVSARKEREGLHLHQRLSRFILDEIDLEVDGPICIENSARMYEELAERLNDVRNLNSDERAYVRLLSESMRKWTRLCLRFVLDS